MRGKLKQNAHYGSRSKSKLKVKYYIMFPVCNLLTGAKEPGGCLWQAGFAPVFLRQTRVILSFETISYI